MREENQEREIERRRQRARERSGGLFFLLDRRLLLFFHPLPLDAPFRLLLSLSISLLRRCLLVGARDEHLGLTGEDVLVDDHGWSFFLELKKRRRTKVGRKEEKKSERRRESRASKISAEVECHSSLTH